MKNIHTIGERNGRSGGSSNGSSTQGGSNDGNPTFSSLWKSIPPVSRTILLLMSLLTSITALQLVNAGYFIFQFNEVLRYRQWWRLFTAFLLLPPNAMSAVMELYNMGTRAVNLENDRFLVSRHYSSSIDFAFYLLFCLTFIISSCVLIYGKYESLVLTSAFDACLTLTWAIDNSNVQVRFYGIIPVYGKFYPLLQGVMAFIFGGDLILILLGFTASYIFNCLDTRTLGPIWGLVMQKGKWYGVVPTGKFHAPKWFIWVYEFLFGGNYLQKLKEVKVKKAKAAGQRLGSGPSTGPTRLGSGLGFTGGQKLGGIDSMTNQGSTIPVRDYLATGSRSNLTSARSRTTPNQNA